MIIYLRSCSSSAASSRTGSDSVSRTGSSQLSESPLPNSKFARQIPGRRTFTGGQVVDRRLPAIPQQSSVGGGSPAVGQIVPSYLSIGSGGQVPDYSGGGLTPEAGRHTFLDKLTSKFGKRYNNIIIQIEIQN